MDSSTTDLTPGISTQKLQPSNLSTLSGVIARSISTTTRFDLPIEAKSATIIAQRGSTISVGAISLTEAGSAWTDDTVGGWSGGASLSSPISGISGVSVEMRPRAIIVTLSSTTNIIIHYHA